MVQDNPKFPPPRPPSFGVSMKTRKEVLEKALELTTGDRVASYGDPKVQHDIAGRLWKIYKEGAGDKYTPAHEAAMFQVILKISRIATGKGLKDDHYIDGAAYFGIAYECQQSHEDLVTRVADHH